MTNFKGAIYYVLFFLLSSLSKSKSLMTAHSIPSLCFRLSKKATITISIFKNNKTIIELLTKFSNDGFFANCAIIKTAMNKK